MDKFCEAYVAIALLIIMYPILLAKDLTILIKINSYGALSAIFVIVIIFCFGLYGLNNT